MRLRPLVVLAATLVCDVALPAAAAEPGAPAPATALAAPEPAPPMTRVPEARSFSGMNWAGFGIRIGVLNLDVDARDVPLFGDDVKKAMDAWNKLNPGSELDEDAMNLKASLVQVVPTLHLGGEGFFFRIDLPIGFGDDITTLGLGLYPLAYGTFIESLGLFPYVAAGGTAHYATSGRVTARGAKFDVSQSGAFLQGRLAVGAKLRAFEQLNGVLEFGYAPFTIAGLVDTEKLDAISNGDLRVKDPASAVRAGVGSSFDFSVGIEWL